MKKMIVALIVVVGVAVAALVGVISSQHPHHTVQGCATAVVKLYHENAPPGTKAQECRGLTRPQKFEALAVALRQILKDTGGVPGSNDQPVSNKRPAPPAVGFNSLP